MPHELTLSTHHLTEFERTGLLRLPAFFDQADIAHMADAVWADLTRRFGVRRDDPATWTVRRPAQFQLLVAGGAFAGLDTVALRDLADQMLGAGAWERPSRWGQPLVTFPAASWDLPKVAWHFDLPGAGRPWPFPGLRLFTFLEPVLPHGGGTLCLSGSCRLAARFSPQRPLSSERLRTRLKAKHRWIADLCATPGDEVRRFLGVACEVDGCALSVEEMTGAPGDLVVMHPLTLHGLAHNALDRPRMMLVQSLWAL